MPSIEKRISPKTGKTTYRAKVRLTGFPPQTNTFDRKTDAQRWAQRTEAELREGKHFPENQSRKRTLVDLIDHYLDHVEAINPRRGKEIRPLLNFWKEQFGTTLLTNVTSAQVLEGRTTLLQRKKQRKENGREVTLKPSTVNRHLAALRSAFAFGISPLKWIQCNPSDDVKKLKEPSRDRFLSKDERSRLLSACKQSKNPYLFAIVLLGISTGARRSELRGLRWDDISEDCSQAVLRKTKNGDIRSLIVTGKALAVLKAMKERRETNAQFLFPSSRNPNRPVDFETAWRRALKASGITDFRFHDLRHTCASYLAMDNASALEIMNILGHKSLAMTQRYAHLTAGHTVSVVASMTEKELGDVEI